MSSAAATPLHAIIVDPDARRREGLAFGLGRDAFVVSMAADAREAVAMRRAKHVDVVVSMTALQGLSLGGMAGLLRAAGGTPVVAYGDESLRAEAAAAGAVEFLPMPLYLRDVSAVARLAAGLHAGGGSRAELRVEDFGETRGLHHLVRGLAAARKSALLLVERRAPGGPRRGGVRFVDGELFTVRAGRHKTGRALEQLLLWDRGRAEVKLAPPEPGEARRVFRPNERLLEDGRRVASDIARAAGRVGGLEAIFRRDEARAAAVQARVPPEVWNFLSSYDGSRAVVDLIDDAPFKPLDTLMITFRLAELGAIVSDAKTSVSKAAAAAAPVVDDKPVVVEAKQAVVEAKQAVVEAKQAVVEAKQAVVEAKPAVVEAKPAVVEAKQAVVEAKPAVVEAKQAVVEAKQAVVEAKQAVVAAKPAVVEAKPVVVEPARPKVEPAKAEAPLAVLPIAAAPSPKPETAAVPVEKSTEPSGRRRIGGALGDVLAELRSPRGATTSPAKTPPPSVSAPAIVPPTVVVPPPASETPPVAVAAPPPAVEALADETIPVEKLPPEVREAPAPEAALERAPVVREVPPAAATHHEAPVLPPVLPRNEPSRPSREPVEHTRPMRKSPWTRDDALLRAVAELEAHEAEWGDVTPAPVFPSSLVEDLLGGKRPKDDRARRRTARYERIDEAIGPSPAEAAAAAATAAAATAAAAAVATVGATAAVPSRVEDDDALSTRRFERPMLEELSDHAARPPHAPTVASPPPLPVAAPPIPPPARESALLLPISTPPPLPPRNPAERSGRVRRVDPSGPQRRVEPSAPQRRVEPSGPQRRVEPSGPQRRVEPTGPHRRADLSQPSRRADPTGRFPRAEFDAVDEEFFAGAANLHPPEPVDYFDDLTAEAEPVAEEAPDLRRWLPFGSRLKRKR